MYALQHCNFVGNWYRAMPAILSAWSFPLRAQSSIVSEKSCVWCEVTFTTCWIRQPALALCTRRKSSFHRSWSLCLAFGGFVSWRRKDLSLLWRRELSVQMLNFCLTERPYRQAAIAAVISPRSTVWYNPTTPPDATGWKVNSGRLANETPHVATRMEGRLGSVHDPSTNRWRCVCSGLSRKNCPV